MASKAEYTENTLQGLQDTNRRSLWKLAPFFLTSCHRRLAAMYFSTMRCIIKYKIKKCHRRISADPPTIDRSFGNPHKSHYFKMPLQLLLGRQSIFRLL